MSDNHLHIWNGCLEIIRDNVSPETFSTWFAPIVPISHINGELTIQTPSTFYYEYLEENFLGLLQEAITKVAGGGTRLMYHAIVDNHEKTAINIPGSQTSYKAEKPTPTGRLSASMNPFKTQIVSELNPQLNFNYTFHNFVEGTSNKLARSAAVTVALRPGKNAFNPLFIYGNSGIGKTHLLHSIGLSIKERDPDARVLYVSTHLFQVQFTDSILNNKVNDFINFYQSIDVLLIDDIQELIGKERTQNTFFNIFNHLHQTGKQLVMTCDKSPIELKGMSERLLTRFRWGLAAELEMPDFELRKSILISKIRRDGLTVSDDVVDFVASKVTNSVRELEGSLVSLIAYAAVFGVDVNMSLAESVMMKCVKSVTREITLDVIQDVVCDYYSIDMKSLHSKSRKREIVNARQISMYLSKKYTDYSYSRIGEIIGRKDHATVVHACNVIKDQIAIDKKFSMELTKLEDIIKGK